jgi:hypothetical protein
MTEDGVLLTGRPATVMRAMLRGLKLEMSGKDFPGELDDWECALADFCSYIVRAKKLYDTGAEPRTAIWRGKKFVG